MAKKGKVIWDGAWLINVLFFDCASVLTKSVAEVTFSLAYVLNVAFVALYHKNELGRRAGDVMSYTSLFIGREKRVRRGSHCNEKTRLAPTLWQRKAPGAGGRGWGLPTVFGPDQYVTYERSCPRLQFLAFSLDSIMSLSRWDFYVVSALCHCFHVK